MAFRTAAVALALLLAVDGVSGRRGKMVSFPGAVPHVSCAVCKEGMGYVGALIEDYQDRQGVRMKEDEIISTIEAACNPKTRTGRWLRFLDIVESATGAELEVEQTAAAGKFKRKQKTLEEACQATLMMDTDLSAMIYKGTKIDKLIKYQCHQAGEGKYGIGPCHKKFKKGKLTMQLRNQVKAEEFEEEADETVKAQEQAADMAKETGIPEEAVKMYHRDNIDDMAIDELMKEEAMDEDEARDTVKRLREMGAFDAPPEGADGAAEKKKKKKKKGKENEATSDDGDEAKPSEAELREAFEKMKKEGYFGADDKFPMDDL